MTMADDTRDSTSNGTPGAGQAGAGSSEPPKKFPKGVVLGPDGKPYVVPLPVTPRPYAFKAI